MIMRLWHGWTTNENADAYDQLVSTKILPAIHRIQGYQGAYLLRRPVEEGVEFITLTMWDSMDAVKEFDGGSGHTSVVPAEARAILSHFDDFAENFEYRLIP